MCIAILSVFWSTLSDKSHVCASYESYPGPESICLSSIRYQQCFSMFFVIVAALFQFTVQLNGASELALSDDSLQSRLIRLEQDLQSRYTRSTYVRAIIWNELPSYERLKKYFDRFTELRFNEEWLDKNEFDTQHVSDTTYERYFHKYCPEKSEYAMVFVKFTFTSDDDPLLIDNASRYTTELLTRYLGNDTNRTLAEDIASSDVYSAWWFVSCGALVVLYATPHINIPSSVPQRN